ncbi:hypothetical protein GQ55_2G138800 [Panicum hallii var. hallii]|uniref:FCP1 homology domain-containing protein n=1 Tax=Panicum hallii var. hallii TaxID=1504633 RepID=A0A2T7EPL7_9POAL|nr:hypothetical protein GQ55_2G138800 [Panicum hallii var. hallii]
MSNLDSTAAAAGRGTAEREPTAASVPALNGTPKRMRRRRRRNKMREQQDSPPGLDSTVAAEVEEQGAAKGRRMEEREAPDAAASGMSLNGTMKCKNKKKKNKNKMQKQQESPPDLDSTVAAETEEQGEAKGRGMEEREATDAAASALNGTPKCMKRRRKRRINMREQQDSLPGLDSTVAAEAEEQGEAKRRGMEEREATEAAASGLNGTMKCKNKKKKKKNKMQEQQESPPDLDSTAAAEAEEQGEAKGRGMEEREATAAAASALEGTPKCDQEEAKVKDSVMLKEEATDTVVSASEGTPKRKRKKRNKMHEQLESPHPQATSVIVGVDKIMSNKSENGCADGVEASGHADVNMDPINGEDPSCAQSNANDADILVENCYNNLQESSAERKRQKRKRKWGSSSRGPGFSSENDGMVAKDSLDSSAHHDLSCVCASCLVEARKDNIKNIYSPRGSLVRFRRKKLLILDLNGLLADINQDYHNVHKADAKVKNKLVFRRPYYDDFLRFCFQNFELGIWSSRKRENVSIVVNILMRNFKQHLLFRWDMSYCTVTGCNTVDNKNKPLVLKELKKLWNKEDPKLPWKKGEFSPSNTLLVDDSPYKALCNPPNTAIFPHPYSYRNQSDDSLGPGGDLRMYLERVAAADNVQNFVRDNPFGQNAITESDPNWNFYVQIVDKVEKANRIIDKVEKANSG